jgi:NAD(P)H-dependent FMN reductase
MTRILLISGSTRDSSVQTAALRTAARHAPRGVITASLYQGLRDIPAYAEIEGDPPPAVTALRQQVNEAQALLFSTPQIAGTLPGAFKNLLDWLIDGRDLSRKPVAWLCVDLPGRDEGARAALESVLEHGGARVLRPACIRIPLMPNAIDERGFVTDPQLRVAMLDMLETLNRSLAPKPRETPSWQAYSSVYPVVSSRLPAADWRTQR